MLKIKTALQLLFVTASITSLVACGPAEEPKKDPATFSVEGSYDVSKVSLECSDPAKCTNSLGILMTLTPRTEVQYGLQLVWTDVTRCTASLYSPTQVLTAGHCVTGMVPGTRTYFRTVASPGHPSETFEVNRVLNSFVKEDDLYSNDFAALELKRPAYGYDYVRAPIEISKSLKDVTALVVNQPGSDKHTFSLDAIACEVDTDSKPFHVADYPSIWGTKSCKLIGGNSGGPLFASDNLNVVLGVLSRSTEADAGTLSINLDSYRTPRKNLATVANAACFQLPDWRTPAPRCQTVTKEIVLKMFEAIIGVSVANITSQYEMTGPSARLGNAQVKMTLAPIDVVKKSWDGSDTFGAAFLPRPLCLESGNPSEGNTLLLSAKVYEVNVSNSPITLDDSGSTVVVRASVKKLPNGKWKILYFTQPSTYLYAPEEKLAEQLRTEGLEFDLAPCE